MVAGDNISLFIHCKAAVCVSVIGKADVQPVFHYESLQVFNMGGTDVQVDIESVRAVADHIGIRA